MINKDDMNILREYMDKIKNYIEPEESDAVIFTAVSATEKKKLTLIKGDPIAVQATAMSILREICERLDSSEKENLKAAINYLIFKENKKRAATC